MRIVLGAAIVGVSVWAVAAFPNPVSHLYREMFPSDPGKREALGRCYLMDHNFSRLDSAAREYCYKRVMVEPSLAWAGGGRNYAIADRNAAAASSPQAGTNFVDLWHSAGQGRLQGDIRTRP